MASNAENIFNFYHNTCNDYEPKIDTRKPPLQYLDVSLVVTLNYNALYSVIPIMEVMGMYM